MAGHQASGHTEIEYLMAVALQDIGTDGLEDALAAGSGWRAEDLTALSAAPPVSFRHAWIRAFRTAESTHVVILSGFEIDPMPWAGEAYFGPRLGLLQVLPAFSSWYRLYILPEELRSNSEWMGKARELLERNTTTRKDWLALDKSFVAARKGLMASIAFPSMLRAGMLTVGADARTRLARLAVAVTAYQLKNKKYPATLDDLVPEFLPAIPIDPFDHKPLKMTTADGGLVLYSVGGDGVDGGGVEKHRGQGFVEGDITFCLGPAYTARRGPSAALATKGS